MLKSCKYCGRIHDSKIDCGHKPKKKRFIKDNERIRYTRAMTAKSKAIKEQAHYMCEVCRIDGRITYEGLETHHIVKLVDRPDLALEDDNLICLCRNCHEKAEKGEISKKFLVEITRNRSPLH